MNQPGGSAGPMVTLRPGQAADAAALARVFLAARGSAQPRFAEPHGEAAVAAWLEGVLLARHRVTVAAAGGMAIGYLGLDAAAAEILHLYVSPPWQRQGVGASLLRQARAAMPSGLGLIVFESNHAARAFYERHGFRAGAFRPGTANEEGMPDVRYVWSPTMPKLT
ncbi:N-acetyltransferase [Dankookia rubra]|uniref:N-acetyltransferase n=1 Tax=Dankookia rubra TaxID=1442381 RepID=A0A4R5QHX6_9PROT|nr:GNAT family N-acetyltransferase [Dankookia rubra]TDH62974.1 N-acetyltransferase [Dankookia rubra]